MSEQPERPPPWYVEGVDYSGDPWFLTEDAHTEWPDPPPEVGG
jgi:hypothetical protein